MRYARPEPAGRHDDGLRAKDLEAPALAVVAKRSGDAAAVHEQRDDRVLHVHVEALVHAVILERADHLEARAIADVREARVAMAAEVALQDAAVLRAIEDRAPGFELADAVGGFLRVKLGHLPVVEVLPAAHRVGEVHAPVVAVVGVGERRRHAALGHDGVRLAQQRLRDDADLGALRGRFDGRAQTRAAGANDEDVVINDGMIHQRIRIIREMPIEHNRT